ncbi:MAG: hypothetical protein ACRCX2_16420, partial [Paraclostridium sp.]
YEAGGAKIVLELDRNNALGGNLVNAINDIIQFSKPVGVGFSIEPFSSASILDKYSVMAIESEIDRYNNIFMLSNKIMDEPYHMYDTYYMNISVDRYIGAKIEN